MGNDKALEEAVIPTDPRDVHDVAAEPEEKKWYRQVFFQATVVGMCAFLAPGLYNAMQSTGAGGQQTPYLVMFVVIVLSSLLSTDSVSIGLLMLFSES